MRFSCARGGKKIILHYRAFLIWQFKTTCIRIIRCSVRADNFLGRGVMFLKCRGYADTDVVCIVSFAEWQKKSLSIERSFYTSVKLITALTGATEHFRLSKNRAVCFRP